MEKSVFDLEEQNSNTDSRIVVALERISQSFRTLLWQEAKQISLSPIQIQILLFVHFHSNEKNTVSYLAKEFNLTKATISEAVKNLFDKGYLEKEAQTDTRSFVMRLSPKGIASMYPLSHFANPLRRPLSQLSSHQKEVLLSALLEIIKSLQQAGIISIQRMCATCQMYTLDNGQPYCKLQQLHLAAQDLRVDCPEHLAK